MEVALDGSPVGRITFAEALHRSRGQRRHVLLGNGFSLSLHDAFGYPSLFREAVGQDSTIGALFSPGDPNFETALRACTDPADARRIRRALIRAVAAVHPENSLHLTEAQCRSCWDFLAHFIGSQRARVGTVHTTNYDLLLHWALSRQGKRAGTKQHSPLRSRDGFTAGGRWLPGEVPSQVSYLHGAVHIFQPERTATTMLRYDYGRALMRQVDKRIAAREFPVFIAEGTSGRKEEAIERLAYLRDVREQFRAVMRNTSDSLFTFGHSFGESDNHIAGHIADGTMIDIYIAAFSPKDERRASELAFQWNRARRDKGRPPVGVRYFHPSECSVWTRYDAVAA